MQNEKQDTQRGNVKQNPSRFNTNVNQGQGNDKNFNQKNVNNRDDEIDTAGLDRDEIDLDRSGVDNSGGGETNQLGAGTTGEKNVAQGNQQTQQPNLQGQQAQKQQQQAQQQSGKPSVGVKSEEEIRKVGGNNNGGQVVGPGQNQNKEIGGIKKTGTFNQDDSKLQ